MAAYQTPAPGAQPAYDASGQQYASWGPQAANWAAQQQPYQYPNGQQNYGPYAVSQATNTQYVGQGYDAQGGMAMYGAGYDYSNMAYNQGYVGQPASNSAEGTQHYGAGDANAQQYGYVQNQNQQQAWGGWDQSAQANGMGAMSSGMEAGHASRGGGRGRGAGPPAFGSGRGGGPPAFGSGRGGGPPEFGSGQGGGPPEFGGGRGGGPPEFGGGQGGGPPEFGGGRGGGPPTFGGGRGGGPPGGGRGSGQPAFGGGRGSGQSAFGGGRGDGKPAFGSGRGGGPPGSGRGSGQPAFGGGRGDGKPAFGSGRGGGKPAFGSGREGGPPAFGSGRGSGNNRGRGTNGDRGRGGGDRGRGGGANRGRGFGGDRGGFGGGRNESEDRFRGSGGDRGRGRGGMGRGDGGSGRGRGGGSMGSDRGRGAGGRGGAAFGGRGGTRGQEGGGRDGMVRSASSQESVTVADTGVGLSSIGDLIKSAQQRRLQDASKGISQDAPLSVFVDRWKNFSREFVDCGNAISNLECSLKASKLDLLSLRSETDLLSKVSNTYNIFTSTLILVKKFAPLDQRDQESIFLARGLGLNKKSAKADCYQKAYKLLMESPVDDIMSQVDTDEATLRREIQILHKENPKGFMDLLRKTTEVADKAMSDGSQQNGPQQAPKRKVPVSPADQSAAKKPRQLPEDYLENQSSLAPKKKQGILMQRSAPLRVKLTKLKELLKEEGITKLHIVPKIDQFAHKTAITIRNVYKFIDIPTIGYEHKTPLYCEIYFDDVWVATSEPHIKRNAAMHQAYQHFTDRLCTEPVDEIANNPKSWSVAMESMPDVCQVYTKWQGEDNDSLHTSNLANMKQMMHSMPQLKFPIQKMVLTEHETDKNIENIFKSLELSATRNLVLLECEILRNLDNTFTCNISLQGKVMASRSHAVKNAAKRLASEAVMNQLKKTNDFIYVTADYVGDTYTKDDLFKKAQEKKDAGAPLSPYLENILSKVLVRKPPEGLTPDALKRFEEDASGNAAIEDLPENQALRPLLPYLALVVYDILDNYYESLSLEDVIFDVKGMARSQREVVGLCATKMGMRFNTKVRNMEQSSLLRRSVTASDMSKILQILGGSSGRYKLTKCQNPCSKEELDAFKKEYLRIYQDYKSRRDIDEEEEAEPKRDAAPPPQIPSSTPKKEAPSPKPVGSAKSKGPSPNSSSVSAWENNKPLDFKGSAGGAGRGSAGGARPAAPPGGRMPRPLMAGPVEPRGQRPVRPAPPRHSLHQRAPQPLMQTRPQRMPPPRSRMGGPFQY
ncbi:hypothetical protein ElyMa_005352600 [Elysia marginata]|uniref:DRBM domain-containing protein n=1 Tax=Elysia marginata TaxID=1093978 RepID=A0AAV4EAS0_9GAST|nr:hypothetical protein ElyMa_005352600 [Elysia marginata]